jgi:hypothetical protein
MNTHRYLYPRRRQVELISALYALGFGLYVATAALANHSPPIAWLGYSTQAQLGIAQAMCIAAFIHALGIRINGHWRWSPVLRVIGMTTHVCVMGLLTYRGFGTSAGYTYTWITAAMAYGVFSAMRDSIRAWQGESPVWSN